MSLHQGFRCEVLLFRTRPSSSAKLVPNSLGLSSSLFFDASFFVSYPIPFHLYTGHTWPALFLILPVLIYEHSIVQSFRTLGPFLLVRFAIHRTINARKRAIMKGRSYLYMNSRTYIYIKYVLHVYVYEAMSLDKFAYSPQPASCTDKLQFIAVG